MYHGKIPEVNRGSLSETIQVCKPCLARLLSQLRMRILCVICASLYRNQPTHLGESVFVSGNCVMRSVKTLS